MGGNSPLSQPLNIFVRMQQNNKDENAHRFALSAIRGELLERERERDRETKRERENEREKERETKRDRKTQRERQRERDKEKEINKDLKIYWALTLFLF